MERISEEFQGNSFTPFPQINSRLIEKQNLDIYHYTYDRQDHYEQFMLYSAYFVGYLKLWEPIEELGIRIRLKWIIFISEILKKYNHPHEGTETIYSSLGSLESFRNISPGTIPMVHKKFRELSAEKIVKDILGLKYIELEEDDIPLNVWGSRYWLFFHYTTFCINGYGKDLINSMADLMLNLHLIIVCPDCYVNLFKHNILDNVTVPMRKTQDPISIIYNFHNVVNASLYSSSFSQNDFCQKYKCEMKFSRKINYIHLIKV